jgi:hypothetical protein
MEDKNVRKQTRHRQRRVVNVSQPLYPENKHVVDVSRYIQIFIFPPENNEVEKKNESNNLYNENNNYWYSYYNYKRIIVIGIAKLYSRTTTTTTTVSSSCRRGVASHYFYLYNLQFTQLFFGFMLPLGGCMPRWDPLTAFCCVCFGQ